MNLLEAIEQAAEALLPAPARPLAKVLYLAIEGADGKRRVFGRDDIETIAARETAAGEAAHKAAKLAGMREAIEPHVNRAIVGVTSSHASLDAIMAEIARRL